MCCRAKTILLQWSMPLLQWRSSRWQEETVGVTLLEEIPEPVAILSESESPDLGISEFDLENGVRVLVMPTDFKDDEILFTGFSLGGSSLVNDEDYPEASTIVNVITESGVGAFGQSELEKLLTGKDIAISPYLRELTEGIEGNSSVADMETLFQLIYLYATEPRADQDAFDVFQKQMRIAPGEPGARPKLVLAGCPESGALWRHHPPRHAAD